MVDYYETLIKELSRNDVGETGGHQAGIVVPRVPTAIEFFPHLDVETFNPRTAISVVDTQTGTALELNYIYYNGKLTGVSTRNEYRLTGLSRYLKDRSARAGDSLVFTRNESGDYFITHEPKSESEKVGHAPGSDVVVLSGKWRSVRKGIRS